MPAPTGQNAPTANLLLTRPILDAKRRFTAAFRALEFNSENQIGIKEFNDFLQAAEDYNRECTCYCMFNSRFHWPLQPEASAGSSGQHGSGATASSKLLNAMAAYKNIRQTAGEHAVDTQFSSLLDAAREYRDSPEYSHAMQNPAPKKIGNASTANEKTKALLDAIQALTGRLSKVFSMNDPIENLKDHLKGLLKNNRADREFAMIKLPKYLLGMKKDGSTQQQALRLVHRYVACTQKKDFNLPSLVEEALSGRISIDEVVCDAVRVDAISTLLEKDNGEKLGCGHLLMAMEMGMDALDAENKCRLQDSGERSRLLGVILNAGADHQEFISDNGGRNEKKAWANFQDQAIEMLQSELALQPTSGNQSSPDALLHAMTGWLRQAAQTFDGEELTHAMNGALKALDNPKPDRDQTLQVELLSALLKALEACQETFIVEDKTAEFDGLLTRTLQAIGKITEVIKQQDSQNTMNLELREGLNEIRRILSKMRPRRDDGAQLELFGSLTQVLTQLASPQTPEGDPHFRLGNDFLRGVVKMLNQGNKLGYDGLIGAMKLALDTINRDGPASTRDRFVQRATMLTALFATISEHQEFLITQASSIDIGNRLFDSDHLFSKAFTIATSEVGFFEKNSNLSQDERNALDQLGKALSEMPKMKVVGPNALKDLIARIEQLLR